jgi:ABC-type nitrate/sulfonate/bicarbonate transport system permease component
VVSRAVVRLPSGDWRSSGRQSLKIALRVGLLLGVIALWQSAGSETERFGLPTFTRTVTALVELIADGTLLPALLATNLALVGGFALALAVSLPLGIAMGTTPWTERLAQPYLMMLLATPMITLVPVIQVAFGLTLWARIVVVFVFSFIYMTVNVMTGVRSVSPGLLQMASSFGASRRQRLRWVVLPGAVPAVMAGIRLGLGRAIIGMVVAELTLVGAGVGSLIIEYQVRYQPGYVFAVVLITILEGVLLLEIARRIERRFSRWDATHVLD